MTTFGVQFLRYYCVGTIAVALDVLLFQILVVMTSSAIAAAAIAGPVAAGTHFTLNRVWSFNAVHGDAVNQVQRYAIIYSIVWAVTLGIVSFCVGSMHFSALEAKGVAIAVTLPIGFAGHKCFTYAKL